MWKGIAIASMWLSVGFVAFAIKDPSVCVGFILSAIGTAYVAGASK